MSIINQNPDDCLKDISIPVTDLINKALEVYERWDRWFEGLFKQEKITCTFFEVSYGGGK